MNGYVPTLTKRKIRCNIQPTNIDFSDVYFFPNRPVLLPPFKSYINDLEKTGEYVAEYKYNGDNTMIYTKGGGDEITWYNRYGKLLSYKPLKWVNDKLNEMFPPKSIINGELVHRHTKTEKNLLIIHCIMMYNGQFIETYGESRELLKRIEGLCDGLFIKVSKIIERDFWNEYETIKKLKNPVFEGIIIKKYNGRFIFSTKYLKNVSWMYKVRCPK